MGHLPSCRVLFRGSWQEPGAESQTHAGGKGISEASKFTPHFLSLLREALTFLSGPSLGGIMEKDFAGGKGFKKEKGKLDNHFVPPSTGYC